jgi:hypothetical protein
MRLNTAFLTACGPSEDGTAEKNRAAIKLAALRLTGRERGASVAGGLRTGGEMSRLQLGQRGPAAKRAQHEVVEPDVA